MYVEVAGNLTPAFRAAAHEAGGLEAPADRHFQSADRFAHPKNADYAAHAWLMGQPVPGPCSGPSGPEPSKFVPV